MCKSESSQNHESRFRSNDSSKVCSKPSVLISFVVLFFQYQSCFAFETIKKRLTQREVMPVCLVCTFSLVYFLGNVKLCANVNTPHLKTHVYNGSQEYVFCGLSCWGTALCDSQHAYWWVYFSCVRRGLALVATWFDARVLTAAIKYWCVSPWRLLVRIINENSSVLCWCDARFCNFGINPVSSFRDWKRWEKFRIVLL